MIRVALIRLAGIRLAGIRVASALVLLLAAAPAQAEIDGLRAGARVELVPDVRGQPWGRVAHGLRLGVALDSRWRLDVAAAARLTTVAAPGPRAVELNRVALAWSGDGVSLSVGRIAAGAATGSALLDGIAVRVGRRADVVGGRAWFGHPWHPELGLTEHPGLAGGVEVHARPPGRGGGRGPVVIAIGAGLRGAGGRPQARVWAHADGIDGAGGRWAAGIEGGLGAQVVAPGALRAWGRASRPLGRALRLGIEARWEGLPRLVLPLGTPSALELLAPDGYGVARGRADVTLGPVRLGVSGGPTLQPTPHRPVLGGIARIDGGAPIGRHGELGAVGIVAAAGGSRVVGGGASGALRTQPLDVHIDALLLRLRGLDGAEAWVGEVRARAAVFVPTPSPRAPDLRVGAEIAGGADRMLLASIRGGLAVELVLPGSRGGVR